MQRRPALLTDLVNGAIEANRAAIESGGIRLVVQLPDASLWLLVDPTRFVQVLSNLLNNAAKFTDPGGHIVVNAQVVRGDAADHLQLSVRDTGIGIPSEMLARIFDLFTQVQHASPRAQGGLGIGLALARRIIEMHQGRIDVNSHEGHGSEFTIRLPLLDRVGHPATDQSSTVNRPAIQRRALIVDDNADAAEMLAALVRMMGGEAVTAGNGLDGIRLASTFAPHIVFLDIGMAAMDGYETCRRIRLEPFGQRIVIVALTGWGQERDKQHAADAGFDAHLTKPADPLELERLLSAEPLAFNQAQRD